MGEKQDYSQPEFFTQNLDSGNYKPHRSGQSFFLRIRGYEKAILLIMILVLASIISFSIGVERGKRIIISENNKAGPFTYTIQVAAFKNRGLALETAQALTNEGNLPLVFVKGGYIILCVGKFSNQESAQPLLAQLQKTYAGCRIRRL